MFSLQTLQKFQISEILIDKVLHYLTDQFHVAYALWGINKAFCKILGDLSQYNLKKFTFVLNKLNE